MKKAILLLSFITSLQLLSAQTQINGIINSDSVLSEQYSPYLVNSNLTITPDGSVTIEPGVEICFSSGIKLEVRGTLIAEGAAGDSIAFTSASMLSKGSWIGIEVKNDMGANASFSYCKFLNATTAIEEWCCWGGNVSVRNSRFSNNITAMGGYSGDNALVDSCLFTNNTYCLRNADKIVTNCVFLNNEYGLYETERISVYNSTFRHHTGVALYGGRGDIDNCIIEDNNTGVKAFFEGFDITNSTISNNNIGIELGDYDGYVRPIANNEICNNTTFNIINNSERNLDLYGNCWCTTDSAIIEDKILDGYDPDTSYFTRGLVSYDILDESCDSVIKKIDKTNINNMRIWTLSKSPYTIETNYIIFPDDTLKIEPGVEVRFGSGVRLEVRGTLIAEGAAGDSITFTSASMLSKGSWIGIEVKNDMGADATFSYCKFLNATTAIEEWCCWGGNVSVRNSRFSNNITAMGGYSGDNALVDSCLFTNNTYCLRNADKIVTNCVFLNNEYGLYETERISVYNSTFRHHTGVALYGGRGDIDNCIIEDNNTGVKAFFEGFDITNSTISNNNIGIEFSDYDGYVRPVEENKICHNKVYNVKNRSDVDIELYTNCWCTDDSTIIEDKILDGWDSSSYGLVDYTIFANNCLTPVLKTIKSTMQVIYFTDVREQVTRNILLYPNPAVNKLYIKNNNNRNFYIEILNINGQIVLSSEKDIIDISGLKSGVYLARIKVDSNIFISRLTVIK
jgi:hypothetical protein